MTTTLEPSAPPAPAPEPEARRRRPALPGWTDLVPALLATLTAWLSIVSWRGMVESPWLFLGPLLFAGVLMTVVGWAVRLGAGGTLLALVAQVAVVGDWVLHHVTGSWLPTPGSLTAFGQEMVDGALAGQRFVSPVSLQHPEFQSVLLVSGIAIVLAVDLIATGLRQAALAGLPLLLAITVSASVLLRPVDWLLFVAVAAGWLTLMAVQEGGRLGAWGSGARTDSSTLFSVGGLAAKIGALCVIGAVILTAGLTAEGRDLGDFAGTTGDGTLSAANPMLDMRRNLRETRNVPLVQVTTKDDPAYLRLTTLDNFDGTAWRPDDLHVDDTSLLAGSLPPPEGLSASNQGPAATWKVKVSESYKTRWLPVPYLTSTLTVPGKWRYTPDNLDVVSGSQDSAAGLTYTLSSYDPLVDPATLRTAGPAPTALARTETLLPPNLPPVFEQTAAQVTSAATNDYDRAVALQNWFRESGGFRYSTVPSSGTGIGTLERFITDDRVGYCEQFSTAMAVMARTLGIPARVAVGFLRPSKTGASSYTFGTKDLHAWPELYFEGVGWLRFEPTPPDRTGTAPQYTAPSAQTSKSAQPTTSAKPTVRQLQRERSFDTTNGKGSGSGGLHVSWRLAGAVLVLLLLLALGLLPRLWRRTSSRRRWAAARSPASLADAAWTEVRATALDLDLTWSDRDTVRANGAAVERSVTSTLDARDALRDVVRFVELTRYARPGQGGESIPELRERLQADVRTWQAEMFRLVDSRRVRRARWLPRSLWRRER